MARDHQLFDTARDYFQFATSFFEVINVSATHIYHSALELSPLSSIVRRFYYFQQPHPSPKVIIGAKDSWDPSTTVSTERSYYLSSTWSPCGQLVAVVTQETVQIHDALALKLLSTLQQTKATTRFRPGLAYSPDGHSLAGCSDASIVIWDTQTGGIVTKIGCEVAGDGLELVWGSDGKLIGAISPRVLGALTMDIYNIIEGTTLLSVTLQSKDKPYIWAHDKSFRIATTTVYDHKGFRINIFEAGSTLIKIESFPFKDYSNLGTFSPATYRISVSAPGDQNHNPKLLVLDVSNLEVLLQKTGHYGYPSFSPDASLFGAFAGDNLSIWRYTSGHYTQWREFQKTPTPLQFSPSSSLILGCASTLLHIIHADYSSATLAVEPVTATHRMPQDAYSPHGTYIATTHRGESTITITNLNSHNPSPSQLIETDFGISEIVLTGNVLLVKGPDTVIAWLLTEAGVVNGIFGNRRADSNDSLWSISPQDKNTGFWARLLQQERGSRDGYGHLEFSYADGIGAIRLRNGFYAHIYHAETGEILKPDEVPLNPKRTWYRFSNPHRDDCNLYHHDLHKHYKPLECDWPVSQTTLEEGWVKDQEGNHRLWLHPHWRSAGNDVDWLGRVTTLRLKNSYEMVIIKF